MILDSSKAAASTNKLILLSCCQRRDRLYPATNVARWLMNFRSHARDYEVLPRHSEALLLIPIPMEGQI